MTSTSANPGANADPLAISFLRNGANNFSYSVTKRNQTITFNSLSAQTFGGANFNLTATASSGLGVTYTSSNTAVATVSGSTVTIVGAGSTTITASQGGDSQWNAASNVQQTLTVNKANQGTVTGSLSANTVSIGSTVTSTASGGTGTGAYEFRQNGGTAGAVTFAASGNPRTITGAVAGTAPIEVRKLGDSNYNDSAWVAAGTITVSAAATVPAVSNGAASLITTTTATIAGEVTGNGGSALTERGFVWSTSDSSPTIAEGATKVVVSGTTTGSISTGLTSLTPGTTYHYNTYAINGVGTSYGTAASFITAPNAPSPSISGASVTTTGFTVSWSAVTGAVDYRLDVSTSNTFAQAGEVTNFTNLTVNGTSQAVTGLTAGTTYYVRVRSVNAGGTSAQSSTVTQITVPSAPGTPTVSNRAAYSFTANWTAVTGAADYRLDVSTSSSFAAGSEVAGFTNLTVSGTSQAITGLASSTTYYVRIRAVNTGGTSGQSGTLTVTTTTVPDGLNPTSANPTTSFLGDQVTLGAQAWRDWTDSGGTLRLRSYATVFGRYGNANLTTGTVENSNDNPGSSVDGFTVTAPRFTQTGDFFWAIRISYGVGNDFWFDVSRPAWADLGLSAPSNSPLKIVVSALNNPTGASAAAASSSSIDLTWTKGVSSTAKNTMIVRSTDNVFTAPTQGQSYSIGDTSLGGDRVIFNGDGTSATDSGLSAGTTYYYRFYAVNNSYYSSGADASVATTGTPSITINGSTSASATAFSTTYGTASAAQTFTVAGSNLTANITATAPTGFQVSNNGSTWGTTATFTQSSGSVSNQTLHVRLAGTATVAGTYNSQNITLTSTDATTRNVTTAASGNAVSPKGLGITVANQSVKFGFPATGGTSVVASGSYSVAAGDLVNSESASVVTGTASYSTTYVQGDAAGTAGRTISVSGLTAANYTLNVTNGTVTVTTLQNPTATATATGRTTIDVVTTNADWVMIVRHTADSWVAPNQGTAIAAGSSALSPGVVRYVGPAGTFPDTNLTPGTQYFYKVYTEYFDYYSTGAATTSATTVLNHVYNIPSGTTTVSDNLDGASSSLTKSGNGELVLTGTASTYGNGTVVSAGTLRISNDRALGAVPGAATATSIQIGAATLGLDGTITLDSRRGITLTGGTAIIDDWGNGGDIYNGIIASANGATTSLTKNGGGNLTLGGNNTYTGLTTVNNGTLTITHANALGATGTGNGTTVTANDALRLSDGISVGNEPLELAGTGVTDTGALRSVSGVNSWGGAITLASNVRINTDANSLELSGGITKGARVLFVGGAGNTTISGAITGDGGSQDSITTSIYKNDGGTLTLSGANTYTGATRIIGGNLTVSGSGTLGSGSVVRISSGASLTVNANVTVAGVREAGTGDGGDVSIGSGVTLTVNGNNQGTLFQDSINGIGGNLTFSGTGNTILSLYDAQGYSGTTTVNSGILTSSGAMSTATVNINGGTFRLTSGGTVSSANINIASGGTFDIAGTSTARSLAAGKVLTASATGANTTGTITVDADSSFSLGSGSLNFSAYGGGSTAPLTVSGPGNFDLNSSAVSVSSTTQLAAGTYKLIAKSASGNVTGAPSPTSITVGGSGSVGTASLAVTSGELFLTVAKGAPTITTQPTASAIAFGQTLASSNLSGGEASVPGTFTFTTTSTAPNAGTAAQSVTFTPTDTANYNTITTTVNVTVNAASLPTVTFTAPASLEYTRTAKTYTASASGVTLTLTYTGRNSTSYGPSTTAPTNAGDYTVTATTSDTNYSGSQAQNFSITAKGLTVTGLTGANKVYDRTTAATATGTAALSGVESGDTVTLTGTPTFTFASANVGTGISISTTGYTLGGAQAGNYSLTQPTLSANITAKGLTVTGLTGANKVYDRTTAATATGTAALSGAESGDTVTLTGTPTFTFASANVGTGISISTSGYTLGGAQAGNYSLTQPTLSANITAQGLTVTGLTGANKVYDGTTAATATGTAALSGVIEGDTVTLGGTPIFTFASANVGTGISISTSGYTLGGAQAGNYSLTQPTLSANITKATPTITAAPTASAINEGQALSASTLTGGSATGVGGGALGGEFTFTSPNTQPSVGTASQGVTFTPTDTTNYNNATTSVSVTVNAATQPLPENATLVDNLDGSFTLKIGDQAVAGVSYAYVGRTNGVTGLNTNTFYFLSYSNTNAPVAPGFYRVTATASGAYTGSRTNEYAIAGPLGRPIDLTKIAGVTSVRLNRSTLLGPLQRVATNGVVTNGPTGLNWTATTAGSSTMPTGYNPLSANNTVTNSSSFVTLTPANVASITDTFTLTVSDGVTPVNFPVTIAQTNAPEFDLVIRKLVPIEGDNENMKAIFVTRPNRSITMSFAPPDAPSVWKDLTSTTNVISTETQPTTMVHDGQTVQRPPASVPTGSSGVLEFKVPKSAGTMFFRAKPVIPTNQ